MRSKENLKNSKTNAQIIPTKHFQIIKKKAENNFFDPKSCQNTGFNFFEKYTYFTIFTNNTDFVESNSKNWLHKVFPELINYTI